MLPLTDAVLVRQEKSRLVMSSAKRVILANDSRLLRDMLQRVIDKARQLEVVRQVPDHEELASTIDRFHPEWVIASLPNELDPWMKACMKDYPSVGFVFFSPDKNHIKIRSQESREEARSEVTLKELIQILETDLQPT